MSVAQGTDRRTTFVYDGKRRRRVTREEIKGSSGQWVLASETRYVYDGMRVIQERTSNGVPTVAYTRGPDLSGTLEGAGGIGGLLARSEWDGSAWSRHAFYHSDGVGNVTALAVPNGNDIALAGSYRYDPFGRLIGTPTGLAAINTQRYSSKDWHNASGFYYFGYRFYDPATQRWLNRDPIGEDGGGNLYRFNYNNSLAWIDPDGDSPIGIIIGGGYGSIIGGIGRGIIGGGIGTIALPGGGTISGAALGEAFGASVGAALGGWFGSLLPDSPALSFPNTPPLVPPPDRREARTIKAPGIPTAADGYFPPERGRGSDGELVPNPNGPGKGYPAGDGGVWVPTGVAAGAHGGPHWDVPYPGGKYKNIYPGGRIR